MLLLKLVLCQVCVRSVVFLKEISEDFLESLSTGVLFKSLLRNVLSRLIALLVYLFAKLLVVHLMVVLALHVLAKFLAQLNL